MAKSPQQSLNKKEHRHHPLLGLAAIAIGLFALIGALFYAWTQVSNKPKFPNVSQSISLQEVRHVVQPEEDLSRFYSAWQAVDDEKSADFILDKEGNFALYLYQDQQKTAISYSIGAYEKIYGPGTILKLKPNALARPKHRSDVSYDVLTHRSYNVELGWLEDKNLLIMVPHIPDARPDQMHPLFYRLQSETGKHEIKPIVWRRFNGKR